VAEYRDRSFVGPERNTVTCGAFSNRARTVSKDEFLRPLFAFRPMFEMHPSAFVFAASIADRVVQRCGRFFQTNGVEYFAWPLAASFATAMVHIDAPLVILGRTFKSWGSTIVLSNPGKEQIAKMIADVNHQRDWIPLTNFTLSNLMAEGLLLSKKLFPAELAAYPFDEQQYLRRTMGELRRREAMGVDVSHDLSELVSYANKYPSLQGEFAAAPRNGHNPYRSLARTMAQSLGLLHVRRRLYARRRIAEVKQGRTKSGFTLSGADAGFNDALGCAEFLSPITRQ
jgi:hypothetical protein